MEGPPGESPSYPNLNYNRQCRHANCSLNATTRMCRNSLPISICERKMAEFEATATLKKMCGVMHAPFPLRAQRALNPSAGKSGWRNFCGLPAAVENCFGSEIAAAYRAFHRGGPAGARPIAGKKHILDAAARAGAPLIGAWLGRKCCGDFFDHCGFHELGVAGAGSTSRTSRRHSSMISWRERFTKSYDALTTSCKYWPPSFLDARSGAIVCRCDPCCGA